MQLGNVAVVQYVLNEIGRITFCPLVEALQRYFRVVFVLLNLNIDTNLSYHPLVINSPVPLHSYDETYQTLGATGRKMYKRRLNSSFPLIKHRDPIACW